MQITQTVMAALFFAGSGFAPNADNESANDDRLRVPEALQQTLGLTDMQLAQLRENNRAMVEEVRPLARQLARESRKLHRETQPDAPNESIIGTITMEIIEINGEMDEIRARYQESARAFLNPLQLEALKPIEVAAARARQVRQAAQLNLVELPEQDGPDNEQGGRRQQPSAHR